MAAEILVEIDAARDAGRERWPALYERLTGREQAWLAACRAAVEVGRQEWLARYAADRQTLDWPLSLLAYYRAEHVSVARTMAACAACALHLQQGTGDTPALVALLDDAARLLRVSCWPVIGAPDADCLADLSATLRWSDGPDGRLQALLAAARTRRPSWALAPILDWVAYFMTGQPRAAAATVESPVLLEDHSAGLVARLQLQQCPGGLGQFYPDPLSMAFCDAQTGFAEALAHAWHVTVGGAADYDVCWRLRDAHNIPLRAVEGGSAGAAYALALLKLLAPAGGRLATLDLAQIAITATVDATGQLGCVEGTFEKLLAVARERSLPRIHTVVVSAAQALHGLWSGVGPQADFHILRAASLVEAVDLLKLNRSTRWGAIDCSLPPPVPDYVNRTRLADAVRGFVTQRDAAGYLVIVGGMGVGKSTFLAEFIRSQQAQRGEPAIFHIIGREGSETARPESIAASLYDQHRQK